MRQKIHAAVFYYGLLLLAVAIPFRPSLVNILIIVLSANWLLEGDYARKFQLIRQRPFILLFVGFYLLHVVGLLYSANADAGWFNLEKKLTLLIFPLVIGASVHGVDRKWLNRILASFVAAAILYSLISIGHGLYSWNADGTTTYLFGEELTSWGGLQSIYFGIYVSFAAGVLITWLLTFGLTRMQMFFVISAIAYFFVFMLIMSARMGALSFGLIVGIGGFYYALRNGILKWFFTAAIVLAAIGTAIVFKVDYLRERITSLIETKFYFDPEENNANGLTLRLVKWQCSLEGISSSPVIGVGTGDMQDVLQVCYNEKNFWGRVYEFNSHDQYLQTALGLGIIGMLWLLACLFWMARAAFITKDYLTICFVLSIAMAFLTESVLERKQGVVFYAFFGALLMMYNASQKQQKLSPSPASKDR